MILALLLAAATITATPTELPTPTITPQSEIQKIREVVQQKVKEKLRQIANPVSSKKGIIGKVIQTSAKEIVIDYQNSTRTLTIDTDTTYVDIKRNKASLEKVKIGQDILAMGINNSDTNVFAAKRIIFIDMTTLNTPQTTVIGKIVDISRSSPIFTLIPSKNKNNLFQIKTDSKTALFDKNEKVILTPDLKPGHKIITILTPDTKVSKTYYAQKIIDFDYQSQSALQTPVPTKK